MARLALYLCCLATLAGCAFEPFEGRIETPPLRLRSTIPDDSTTFDAAALGRISLIFRREASEGEFDLLLAPAPLEDRGLLSSPTGRSWDWLGRLDPAPPSQSLLITGPAVRPPQLVRWRPRGDAPWMDSLAGSFRWPRDGSQHAIVAALHLSAATVETDTLAPWFGLMPHGFDVLQRPANTDESIWEIPGLPPFDAYLVVLVVDSDGDGLYRAGPDDWAVSNVRGAHPRQARMFGTDPCPLLPGYFAELWALPGPASEFVLPDAFAIQQFRQSLLDLETERGDTRCGFEP